MSGTFGQVILHRDPPATISADQVYFAFGDGRFGYDCISCGAQCCRGHDFFVGAHDVAHLLQQNVAVGAFFETPDPAIGVEVRSCAPGCFLLNDDGRCGVEIQHGHDAKYETCRLFPFNYFRRLDDYLIVAPHRWLCPLAVQPAASPSPLSAHDTLLGEMSLRGIANVVERGYADVPARAVIALERDVVTLSDAWLERGDYVGFARAQLNTTMAWYRTHAAVLPMVPELPDIDAFRASVKQLIGCAPRDIDEHDPAMVRTLVGATPALRAHLIGDGDAVRHFGAQASFRFPYVMLALHVVAAVAHQAGMKAVTYQTLRKLMDNYKHILPLLAYAQTPVRMMPSAAIDLSWFAPRDAHESYIRVIKALARNVERRPLADILSTVIGDQQHGRLHTLDRLARRLTGRVGPVDDVDPDRPGLSPQLRHLAARHLSTSTLTSLAERRSRGRRQ